MNADALGKRNPSSKLVSSKGKTKAIDGSRIDLLVPVIKAFTVHLETHGPPIEGILRVNGNVDEIVALKKKIFKGHSINLSDYDIHTVAGTLKSILRDLPEPLIPFDLYETALTAGGALLHNPIDERNSSSDKIRMEGFKCVLGQLPHHENFVVGLLVRMCKAISSNSAHNKMTIHNLAIVLGPSMLRPRVETMQILLQNSTKVVNTTAGILEAYSEIYGEEYAPGTPRPLETPSDIKKPSKRSKKPIQRQESQDDMALLRRKVADETFLAKFEEFSKGGVIVNSKKKSAETNEKKSAKPDRRVTLTDIVDSSSSSDKVTEKAPASEKAKSKRNSSKRTPRSGNSTENSPRGEPSNSTSSSKREQELISQLRMLEVKTTMQMEAQRTQMRTLESDVTKRVEALWSAKLAAVEEEWRKRYEMMDSTWAAKLKFSDSEWKTKIETIEANNEAKLRALESHHTTEMNELERLLTQNGEDHEDLNKLKTRYEEALALERGETEKLRAQAMHEYVTRSQLERKLSAVQHDLKRARLEASGPSNEGLVHDLAEARKALQTVLANVRDKDDAYVALQNSCREEAKMKSLLEAELKEAERKVNYLTSELQKLRELLKGNQNSPGLVRSNSRLKYESTISLLNEQLQEKEKQANEEVAKRLLAEKEAKLARKELKLLKQQLEPPTKKKSMARANSSVEQSTSKDSISIKPDSQKSSKTDVFDSQPKSSSKPKIDLKGLRLAEAKSLQAGDTKPFSSESPRKNSPRAIDDSVDATKKASSKNLLKSGKQSKSALTEDTSNSKTPSYSQKFDVKQESPRSTESTKKTDQESPGSKQGKIKPKKQSSKIIGAQEVLTAKSSSKF